MNIVGVIVEYNPLHKGHLYHLQETKKLVPGAAVVAVMSGSWVQRGEPAIINKWTRTKAALAAGVDLVIELPTAFAVQSAQGFARGAVSLLAGTGVIDYICFGSEVGELTPLQKLAEVLAQVKPPWQKKLHYFLSQGVSYPVALGKAVANWDQQAGEILASPNNVLGLEYLQALQQLSVPILPLTIGRQGAGYNQKNIITGQLASATAIRKQLIQGNTDKAMSMLPASAANIIKKALAEGAGPIENKSIINLYLGCLRTMSLQQIAQLPEVNEGLESRLHRAGKEATSLAELLTLLKTRRYTRTRLQRILFYLICNLNSQKLHRYNLAGPAYLRVLGFSDRGKKEILPAIKRQGTLPLVSRPAPFLRNNHPNSLPGSMMALDILANDLQALGAASNYWRRGSADFRLPPVYYSRL